VAQVLRKGLRLYVRHMFWSRPLLCNVDWYLVAGKPAGSGCPQRCNGEIAPERLLTTVGRELAIVGFASVDDLCADNGLSRKYDYRRHGQSATLSTIFPGLRGAPSSMRWAIFASARSRTSPTGRLSVPRWTIAEILSSRSRVTSTMKYAARMPRDRTYSSSGGRTMDTMIPFGRNASQVLSRASPPVVSITASRGREANCAPTRSPSTTGSAPSARTRSMSRVRARRRRVWHNKRAVRRGLC